MEPSLLQPVSATTRTTDKRTANILFFFFCIFLLSMCFYVGYASAITCIKRYLQIYSSMTNHRTQDESLSHISIDVAFSSFMHTPFLNMIAVCRIWKLYFYDVILYYYNTHFYCIFQVSVYFLFTILHSYQFLTQCNKNESTGRMTGHRFFCEIFCSEREFNIRLGEVYYQS